MWNNSNSSSNSTIKKQKLNSNDTNFVGPTTQKIMVEEDSNQIAQIEETISNPGYVSKGLSADDVQTVYSMGFNNYYFTAMNCIENYNSYLESLYKEEQNLIRIYARC